MLSFTACVDGKSGEFYALDVCSISYMNLKMHWNQSEVIHSITDPLGPNPPKTVWKDKEGDCYPPDMVWYEPAGNIGAGLLAEYEERIATEAAEEEEAAREEAELEELELEEALPAP